MSKRLEKFIAHLRKGWFVSRLVELREQDSHLYIIIGGSISYQSSKESDIVNWLFQKGFIRLKDRKEQMKKQQQKNFIIQVIKFVQNDMIQSSTKQPSFDYDYKELERLRRVITKASLSQDEIESYIGMVEWIKKYNIR